MNQILLRGLWGIAQSRFYVSYVQLREEEGEWGGQVAESKVASGLSLSSESRTGIGFFGKAMSESLSKSGSGIWTQSNAQSRLW